MGAAHGGSLLPEKKTAWPPENGNPLLQYGQDGKFGPQHPIFRPRRPATWSLDGPDSHGRSDALRQTTLNIPRCETQSQNSINHSALRNTRKTVDTCFSSCCNFV